VASSAESGFEPNLPPVRRSTRPHLPVAAKHRIVQLFAQFHKVNEVRDVITEEFGLTLSNESLRHYDPMSPKCAMSVRLRELYREARERHLNDISSIGVAHQVHRLRVLDRMVHKAENKEQFSLAAQLLKQAAEEMGGVLTNERTVRHTGAVGHVLLSPEDARQELAMRLSAHIDAIPLPPPETSEDS